MNHSLPAPAARATDRQDVHPIAAFTLAVARFVRAIIGLLLLLFVNLRSQFAASCAYGSRTSYKTFATGSAVPGRVKLRRCVWRRFLSSRSGCYILNSATSLAGSTLVFHR